MLRGLGRADASRHLLCHQHCVGAGHDIVPRRAVGPSRGTGLIFRPRCTPLYVFYGDSLQKLPNMAHPLVLTRLCVLALLAMRYGTAAAPTTGRKFTLAPRRNDTSIAAVALGGGCDDMVYWPGTNFQNGAWTYQTYQCDNYYAYDYIVNVTAQPQKFAWNAVWPGFNTSMVTVGNVGTCASLEYNVTAVSPLYNDKAMVCGGQLYPGDSPVTCPIATVPNQWFGVQGPYYIDIHIENPNWVCNADGSIEVTQTCAQSHEPAGADLCSNGAFYGFVDPSNSALAYVTGGCVSNLANVQCADGAYYCCPDGSTPTTVTQCGQFNYWGDALCYNCTGGC